jgi:hypothetical protein
MTDKRKDAAWTSTSRRRFLQSAAWTAGAVATGVGSWIIRRSTGHSEGAFCNHLAPPQPARTGSMLGRNSALATDNRVIRLRYQFIDQRRGRLATLKVGLDSG